MTEPASRFGMQDTIKNFVASFENTSPDNIGVTKLFGQASSRQYFRVTHKDIQDSKIVMYMPGGFTSPAEEITKIDPDAPQELPFINVQKYLKGLEVLVPEIFATDEANGLLLLSDLGDESLEKTVAKAEGGFLLVYYKKVIDTLIDLQTKTLSHPSKNCIAYHRRFDKDLLNWEFEHFLEYGIEDRFDCKIPEPEAKTFREITQKLTQHIINTPQGFVHRDFQSRNILFKNFKYHLIDFQDALQGPLLYDLVALLRDSYICFTPDQRDALLSHYAESLPDHHPYAQKKDNIITDFHILSLQRKLKDTGRFQYIHTVRKNPNFLQSVPQSLSYVRESFEALKDFDPSISKLHKLIATYVEELT